MAVTFGTKVAAGFVAGTSTALAMTGVTSGQPIVVIWADRSSTLLPSGISDTFSTHYTWTQVDSLAGSAIAMRTWIGTGGAGTSGTITITSTSTTAGAFAAPCIGASVAAGLAAVDVHDITSGGVVTTIPSVSLTPTASGEGAVYSALDSFYGFSTFPASPWTHLSTSTGANADLAVDASPTSGTALTTSWTLAGGDNYVTAGMIVKSSTLAGSAAVTSAGVLAGTGTVNLSGAASLASTAVLAGTGAVQLSGASAFVSAGVLAGTGIRGFPGAANFAASGVLAGVGHLVLSGSANLSSSGVLAGAGIVTIPSTGSAFVVTATLSCATSTVDLADPFQDSILVPGATYYLGLNTDDPLGSGQFEGPDGRQAVM